MWSVLWALSPPLPVGRPHRLGDQLETGQEKGGGEQHAQADGESGVDDGPAKAESRALRAFAPGERDHDVERDEEGEQDQGVRLPGVDGAGHGDAGEHDVPGTVPAPLDEDAPRDYPSRPGHDGGDWPAEPAEERTAELEHDAAEGAGQHAQPEDPAQHVRPGSRDEERHQHLAGVRQVLGEEITDGGRDAERGRLPVERQRHAQSVVRIPKRKVPRVNLGPRQRRPGDHLVDEVAGERVVHPSRANRQSTLGEQVVAAEIGPLHEARKHHGNPGEDNEGDTQDLSPSGRWLPLTAPWDSRRGHLPLVSTSLEHCAHWSAFPPSLICFAARPGGDISMVGGFNLPQCSVRPQSDNRQRFWPAVRIMLSASSWRS